MSSSDDNSVDESGSEASKKSKKTEECSTARSGKHSHRSESDEDVAEEVATAEDKSSSDHETQSEAGEVPEVIDSVDEIALDMETFVEEGRQWKDKMTVEKVPLTDLIIDERINRPIVDSHVETLLQALRDEGTRNMLTVRMYGVRQEGKIALLEGQHRLSAFRRFNMECPADDVIREAEVHVFNEELSPAETVSFFKYIDSCTRCYSSSDWVRIMRKPLKANFHGVDVPTFTAASKFKGTGQLNEAASWIAGVQNDALCDDLCVLLDASNNGEVINVVRWREINSALCNRTDESTEIVAKCARALRTGSPTEAKEIVHSGLKNLRTTQSLSNYCKGRGWPYVDVATFVHQMVELRPSVEAYWKKRARKTGCTEKMVDWTSVSAHCTESAIMAVLRGKPSIRTNAPIVEAAKKLTTHYSVLAAKRLSSGGIDLLNIVQAPVGAWPRRGKRLAESRDVFDVDEYDGAPPPLSERGLVRATGVLSLKKSRVDVPADVTTSKSSEPSKKQPTAAPREHVKQNADEVSQDEASTNKTSGTPKKQQPVVTRSQGEKKPGRVESRVVENATPDSTQAQQLAEGAPTKDGEAVASVDAPIDMQSPMSEGHGREPHPNNETPAPVDPTRDNENEVTARADSPTDTTAQLDWSPSKTRAKTSALRRTRSSRETAAEWSGLSKWMEVGEHSTTFFIYGQDLIPGMKASLGLADRICVLFDCTAEDANVGSVVEEGFVAMKHWKLVKTEAPRSNREQRVMVLRTFAKAANDPNLMHANKLMTEVEELRGLASMEDLPDYVGALTGKVVDGVLRKGDRKVYCDFDEESVQD